MRHFHWHKDFCPQCVISPSPVAQNVAQSCFRHLFFPKNRMAGGIWGCCRRGGRQENLSLLVEILAPVGTLPLHCSQNESCECCSPSALCFRPFCEWHVICGSLVDHLLGSAEDPWFSPQHLQSKGRTRQQVMGKMTSDPGETLPV